MYCSAVCEIGTKIKVIPTHLVVPDYKNPATLIISSIYILELIYILLKIILDTSLARYYYLDADESSRPYRNKYQKIDKASAAYPAYQRS